MSPLVYHNGRPSLPFHTWEIIQIQVEGSHEFVAQHYFRFQVEVTNDQYPSPPSEEMLYSPLVKSAQIVRVPVNRAPFSSLL